MTDIPSHFDNLLPDLQRFHRDGAYDTNVFVMMKFPDAKMTQAHVRMLDETFKIVRDELDRYGLQARRANDKSYSTQLWDNLACTCSDASTGWQSSKTAAARS